MGIRVMAVTPLDGDIAGLARRAGHRVLAAWAADCARRVLCHFERAYPDDTRPEEAIAAARKWARTGKFRMTAIRKASLSSHAAARKAPEFTAARAAARAAGQAVATAHAQGHSIAAAIYAATAARNAAIDAGMDGQAAALRERKWQLQRLAALASSKKKMHAVKGRGS